MDSSLYRKRFAEKGAHLTVLARTLLNPKLETKYATATTYDQ
jgi:hypothetical protein